MHRRLTILLPLLLATACATPGDDAPSPSPQAADATAVPAPPAPEEMASATLRGLAGGEWVLVAWSSDEPAPGEPEVTLTYEDGRVVGASGCNSYFAAVVNGEAPGAITIGPVGSTKKMCAPEAMEVEQRYLSGLGQVVRFDFLNGRLAFIAGTDDGAATLLFERRDE